MALQSYFSVLACSRSFKKRKMQLLQQSAYLSVNNNAMVSNSYFVALIYSPQFTSAGVEAHETHHNSRGKRYVIT
jgi:hypothetical protein